MAMLCVTPWFRCWLRCKAYAQTLLGFVLELCVCPYFLYTPSLSLSFVFAPTLCLWGGGCFVRRLFRCFTV
ncbi:hypothetical protein V8C86DRAFT_2781566, partial [Haematococcus lacustris]